MNKPSRIPAVAVIALLFAFPLQAQVNDQKFEIGLALSAFVYQGDLTPNRFGSFETTRWGINLHGSRIMSGSFLLRTNLAIGGIRADERIYDEPEYRQHRALNSRTPVIELTQLVVWNPLGTNYRDRGFSPYLYAGGGVSFLNVRRDYSEFNAAFFGDPSELEMRLAEDEAHDPPNVIPVIPLGGGVRYHFSPRLAVHAESAYRLLFTDYLDGFSRAANPDLDDHYQTYSLGAIYRIGKKNRLDCPVVRY
jgi:hypothetical protein